MLDIVKARADQHDYYKSCDYPYGINSIEQFAFTDAGQVPELFRNFAVEYFNLERYSRVDVDKLNAVLNELWQGPGSAHIISDAIWDIRIARREGATVKDALKGYVTPTVDSDLVAEED